MTVDQVKYLKEQLNADNGEGKPIANSVFYDLDNGMAFRNNGDFVIFDDANELIHCIAANRNNYVKQESPYCLYSAGYEMLQFTEANLTLDGLKTLLNGMLTNIATEDQKKQIIRWAEALPVNPISTVVSSYHKDPNPLIPQKPLTVVTRPDGVSNGYPVNGSSTSQPIKAMNSTKLVESLGNMEDGTSIHISGSDSIDTAMTVSANNCTISAKDLPVTAAIVVDGEGVTLKGIDISNANLEGEAKTAHMLTINGDNFTMDGCTICDDGETSTRNAVSCKSETLIVKDCVFDGNGMVYNAFEMAYNQSKCKDIIFENCVFKEGAATNNFASFYDFVDNATITFNNCSFSMGENTNAIRLSNINNNHATLNINDCKFETKNVGEYSGLILLQDSSSDKSQDMSLITININNLTNMAGTKKYMVNGTGADRIWYTYGADDEPVVKFA